jgi:hypothetical protein
MDIANNIITIKINCKLCECALLGEAVSMIPLAERGWFYCSEKCLSNHIDSLKKEAS